MLQTSFWIIFTLKHPDMLKYSRYYDSIMRNKFIEHFRHRVVSGNIETEDPEKILEILITGHYYDI